MNMLQNGSGELSSQPELLTSRADVINISTLQEDEGAFLDGLPLEKDPEQAVCPIHEAYGRAYVENGWTHYKAYFSEEATPGLAFIEPGYGGFLKSSEPLGKALARAGLNTVIYDPMRRYNNSIAEDLFRPQRMHVRTQEAIYEDLPRNRTIRTEMPGGKQISEQELVVVCHSMGGLSGPIFALHHADQVEHLFLLETVGVGGSVAKRAFEAATRGEYFGMLKHELIPYIKSDDLDINPKNLLRILRYFGIGNPRQTRISRPIGEAISCATHDMRPTLLELGRMGVERTYVDAEFDVLVHPGRDVASYVDTVVNLRNRGHLSTQVKAHEVAALIMNNRKIVFRAA